MTIRVCEFICEYQISTDGLSFVNNEIIEESTELTEEEKLNQIKEEIGVLPEVGNNIANVIYIILTILAIIGVLTGVYYIKKIR